MEEENNVEPQVEVQNETKKFDLKNTNYKKGSQLILTPF